MKRYLLVLFLMLVPVLNMDTIAAQDTVTPIFFLMEGDIWSYDPATDALANRTAWGYNGAPVLSPDGTQFAYLSVAGVAVDAYENNPDLERFDPEPTNIWVWELAVDDAYRLADQPANAVVSAEDEPQNTISRRELSWSPDGGQLAWIENSSELVVYNFASQTQRVLPIDVSANTISIRWGAGGLAVLSAVEFIQTISVYDPNTAGLLWQTTIDGEVDAILDFFWMESGQLGGFFESGVAAYVDNGEITPMHGMPMLYSLQSPQSNNLLMALNHRRSNGDIAWMNLANRVYNVTTSATISGAFSLAPDGSQAAYVHNGLGLFVFQDGIFEVIRDTRAAGDGDEMGLVWGATGWRESPDAVCPNALPPRLDANQQGTVIPGLGSNALRDMPGKDDMGSTVIGTIPPDGVFNVVGDYYCLNGIRWWWVEYEGDIGFTGEGEGTTYWVEPR